MCHVLSSGLKMGLVVSWAVKWAGQNAGVKVTPAFELFFAIFARRGVCREKRGGLSLCISKSGVKFTPEWKHQILIPT